MTARSSLPFSLGEVAATPAALDALRCAGVDPIALLSRHRSGDWGDLTPSDAKASDDALQNGSRLFSAYVVGSAVKVWIITESDRSVTTILLPDEY